MLDEAQADEEIEADDVQLLHAGAAAHGAFRCADCGYGVSVQAVLPHCPMCGGTAWEGILRTGRLRESFTSTVA